MSARSTGVCWTLESGENSIRISPPLIIDEEQADELLDMEESIREAEKIALAHDATDNRQIPWGRNPALHGICFILEIVLPSE